MKFIELNRRFREIKEKDLEELNSPELLFSFGERFLESTTDDWAKLLEYHRVVLLAEAGSGKTEEMKAQVDRLKREKKYAFYADLAALDRESLPDLLSADDERAFTAWKTETGTPAWFFLDSVDELKLTQGKLKWAINRFAKDVHGLFDCAHVIISCRPSDWKFDLDLQAVQEVLPVVPAASDSVDLTGEELFLAPLRRDEERQPKEESTEETDAVRTVTMLPLTPGQIETYSHNCGVQDVEAFMAEIQRQEAWLFANRPLDCGNLVQIWNAKGKLGTRVEQHEANIAAKLKDDPERPDNDLLTEEEAREGAERLALALALTRTRTVLAPGHEAGEGVLDPVEILPDWTLAQRNALLRRGLFDPATYGRIRFHHRSVEEYLAACRLNRLREKGMPIKTLKCFFFAERYGEEVVIPSMRPIAAWLALWNEDVRRELIRREPEVLLAYGDPGALSIEERTELLRFFADAYGEGGRRGIDEPSIGEVRRLAHPALAPMIRELWEKYSESEEVCDLLLRLIWQGAIKDCVDIAEEVAFDVQRSESQRKRAVFGLVACENGTALRKITESLLAEQETWPSKRVPELAYELFPEHLSVDELIRLIEQTPEPRSVTSGFSWHLEQLAEKLDPSSGVAVDLRNALADLIWQNRESKKDYRPFISRFSYLSSALACLCNKQLSLAKNKVDDGLVCSCVIANFFRKDRNRMGHIGIEKHLEPICEFFKINFREKAFWIETEFMEFSQAVQDGYFRVNRVMKYSILGELAEADKAWLLEVVEDTARPLLHRDIALEALLLLWYLNNRPENDAKELIQAVADDTSLSEKVKKDTAPAPPTKQNPEIEKLRRRQRRRECVRKGRERQRVEKWQEWRKEVLADTETAFCSERVFSTLRDLYHWLERYHLAKTNRSGEVWDKNVITQAFSPEVTSCVVDACKAIWRNESPVLWSKRPEDTRNKILYVWGYALFGLAEDISVSGWEKRLTDEEVQHATIYAMCTWEDFPPWFDQLVNEHAEIVESILGDELECQVAMGFDHKELPLLHHLTSATFTVKKLLASRLSAVLSKWPEVFSEEEVANFSKHHLNRAIKILDETSEVEERASLAAKCAEQFSRNPNGPLALPWLRGVFRFNPEQAAEVLEQGLNAVEKCERADFAERLFAGLFDKDLSSVLPCFSVIEEQPAKINVLKRLVLLSYTFIHPEQDNVHDGVYTPDVRDDAASARSSLLSALLDSSGAEAHKIILELADNPLFAHFSDRLRQLAKERAAKDAEFTPYESKALVTLEKKFEAPPRSRDELFEVLMDRLEDLQHEIAHHKFTIRPMLRRVEQETEMQYYLAGKLHDKANESYTAVEREPEDADRKKPDIRLSAVQGNQQAAIEIKLAENWTIKDFRRALRHQLVGQYLRHENCKAGCLLLTCNGSKRYWQHPETRKRVYFPELIKLLQDEAKAIELEKNHEVRLAVFSLYLTDPHLEPAHGNHRQQEDQMDIEDAEKALADPAENIPAQEVWKELGL